jgi:histidine phosphotransferase ChpT
MTNELTLSALISSRICHDLISPIGAINNGLELFAMTNNANGEEIGLISASAESASDSLRFMRIAFGAASKTEMMSAGEIANITSAHIGTPRLSVEWIADEREMSRSSAKLVLLMAQTTAAAAPLGGALVVQNTISGRFPYEIAITGPKIAFAGPAAQALKGAADLEELEPRYASFALLALVAQASGYSVDWKMEGNAGRLTLA